MSNALYLAFHAHDALPLSCGEPYRIFPQKQFREDKRGFRRRVRGTVAKTLE